MIFAILLERNTRELMNVTIKSYWPVNAAGAKVQRIIENKAKTFVCHNYLIIAFVLIVGTIMLPVFGDQGEWTLCPTVLKRYFGSWSTIPCFFYSATYPFLTFSSVRLCGILYYGMLELHVQIFLLNQQLQIFFNFDDGVLSNKLKNRQKEIYGKLCHCINHHITLKRYTRNCTVSHSNLY
jgi:hypothetical protein